MDKLIVADIPQLEMLKSALKTQIIQMIDGKKRLLAAAETVPCDDHTQLKEAIETRYDLEIFNHTKMLGHIENIIRTAKN